MHRDPAEFGCRSDAVFGAQTAGKDLRAKADPQHRLTHCGLFGHQAGKFWQIGVQGVVQRVLRATKCDHGVVVARNVDPTQIAIVTIGMLQAGIASNVIPESATMGLSVRSFTPEVRVICSNSAR